MPFYVTGTLTFSNQTGRNTARTAMELVVLGKQVWSGGRYAGGITNVGTTGITVSYTAQAEAEATSLQAALLNAVVSQTRTAGHLGLSRVDD